MAQGLFDFRELLLQVYVDDPLWVVRGTPEQRRRRVGEQEDEVEAEDAPPTQYISARRHQRQRVA